LRKQKHFVCRLEIEEEEEKNNCFIFSPNSDSTKVFLVQGRKSNNIFRWGKNVCLQESQ
jgi:hypothetical protein